MRIHSFIVPLALLAPATTFAASIFIPRDVSPASTLPAGWAYSGCYVDSVSARSLGLASEFDKDGLTADSCIAFCSSKGYTVAGTEYTAECYCGWSLPAASGDASTCNMPCSGDLTQACGGPDRLSVYSQSGGTPTVTNPGVDGWTSGGCVADSQGQRTLSNLASVDGAMTVAKCVAACSAGGYGYAGTEYAGECWCGSAAPAASLLGQTGCTMACTGNLAEFCGGPDRLNLYTAPPPPCAATFTSYGMLTNGGFEDGFTGFTPAVLSGTFAFGIEHTSLEGCNAAHVVPTSPPSSSLRQLTISQTVTALEAGASYTFTGYQGRMPATKDYPSPVIGVSVGTQVLGQVTACRGTAGCGIAGPGGAVFTQHVIPFTYGGTSASADLTFTVTWEDASDEGNADLLFDGFKLVKN